MTRYPLTAFQNWMLAQGRSPHTVVLYTSRIRRVLRGVNADDHLTCEDLDVRAFVGSLAPSMQATVRPAWNSFIEFLNAKQVPHKLTRFEREGTAPQAARENPFTLWLQARNHSAGTIRVYSGRMSVVLTTLGVADVEPAQQVQVLTRANFESLAKEMPPARRTATTSAWNSYAQMLEEQGFPGAERVDLRGPAKALSLPLVVQSAIWELLRDNYTRAGFLPLFHSLRWADLTWIGSADVHSAIGVRFLDRTRMGAEVRYNAPLTPWRVLALFQRGKEAVCPCSLDVLHALVDLGKRDRLPLLRVEDLHALEGSCGA